MYYANLTHSPVAHLVASASAVGGAEKLRTLAADWHGAHADNVLITVGAAEVTYTIMSALVRPGDHIVVMQPCYEQVCSVLGRRIEAIQQ